MKTYSELLNEIGFNNSVRPSLDQFQFNDPNQRVKYFKKQNKKRKGSLDENVLKGYQHIVLPQPLEGSLDTQKVKHIFNHRNHQIKIVAPAKEPDRYGLLHVDVYDRKTGEHLLGNMYDHNYDWKNGGPVNKRWHLSVGGSYFKDFGKDQKYAQKVVSDIAMHINNHVPGPKVSSEIRHHTSEFMEKDLHEIVRKKDRWVEDYDKPYDQRTRPPLAGAGSVVHNAGWWPDMEGYHTEKPYLRGTHSWVHPREQNNKITVDYVSSEWEHIDKNKGGNGHVASGRDLPSLKRHLTNWAKIRKS